MEPIGGTDRRPTGPGTAGPGGARVDAGASSAGGLGRTAGALVAAALLAAAAACGGPSRDGEPAPGVVASVPPLAHLAERLVGEDVAVEVMVPPGASPALYEPTLRQMRGLARARLYVAVGHPRFPFEQAWLESIREANPGMAVLPAGGGCRVEPADPHLWLSTRCVATMVDRIAGALAETGSDDGLEARRRSLRATVDSVEAAVGEILAPHRGRSFLVFHPALGYLARDHGLRQIAIQRGATEPGPAELAGVLREARERGIRTVFVQPQFSSEAASLVAEELPEGRLATVDPLARDWSRNLVDVARALAESFEARPAGTRP